ncbi:hypothetical protein LCGC14_2627580 [marine sediment metagenome]|uniref:Uncharacterized protein n=1 Tax=marine sediment metagenome TaxID=412755 RepID=A0A0F9A1D2_9ZZZZ
MKKGYFVKYTGINASVNHNGQYLNAYNFRPGNEKNQNWVEIHELDFEWYKKKAKKNADWHVKEDEVAEVVTKYYAKFLGVGKEKKFEITRYDQDNYGNKIKGTERDYVFPKDEWKEIQQIDAAFFQKKATNDFWEYDKRIITEKTVEEVVEPEPKKKGKKVPEPTVETTEVVE